jgi:hypothetical protein
MPARGLSSRAVVNAGFGCENLDWNVYVFANVLLDRADIQYRWSDKPDAIIGAPRMVGIDLQALGKPSAHPPGTPAMTLLYLLSGALAALAFYLATTHQRLRPSLRAHARRLRAAAWLLSAMSLAAAVHALGPWAGVFASLSAMMLVMVALPYVDAWMHGARARRGRDVG